MFDAVTGGVRTLLVQASAGHVVVIPPSAAGYVVPPHSLRRNHEALYAAENVAAAQRRGYRGERP